MSRIAELEAMISAGWGDTDQNKIPANWREVAGPDPPALNEKRKQWGALKGRRRRASKRAWQTMEAARG